MKIGKIKITVSGLIALLLVFSILAGTAYAAYIAYTNKKRTVSTWNDSDFFFTSNYMESVDYSSDPDVYPVVTVSKGNTETVITVLVCNYNRMNPVNHADSDIHYDFSVTLCDETKAPSSKTITYSDFSIKCGSAAAETMSSNAFSKSGQVLSKSGNSCNTYVITFPNSYDDYLMIEAVPTSSSEAEGRKLGSFITSSELNRTKAQNWEGRLTGLDSYASGDVDGFNFEISGSGASTYVLTWDTDHVEINEWFISDYGISSVTEDGSEKSVELALPLLSTDTDLFHTYHLQFYRTAPQGTGETVSDWRSWITFEKKTA